MSTYVTKTFDSLQENEMLVIEGWICKKRDHGGLLFWEIRQGTEILQIVFQNPKEESHVSLESVVRVKGQLVARAQEHKNPKIKHGNLELVAHQYEILCRAENCPFYPDDEVSEELKAQHRALYLRSKKMQNTLKTRSRFIVFVHKMMEEMGFTMVQTPLLTVSAPEGARDFIVPSRLQKGKFYALPQAPQIFKQLLMCGGISKYYQIAPCFRDESARSTRLYGEFYQIDFEMSFVKERDVVGMLENIATRILKNFSDKPINHNTMTYKEAMKKFGSDKPDMRNPLYLEDFTEIFKKSGMNIFINLINKGAFVKGIRVSQPMSKAEREKTLDFAVKNGFRISYIHRGETLEGPIAKFLPEEICNVGETIFFICDNNDLHHKCDTIRGHLGTSLNLLTESLELVTVLDFPMFEKDENGSIAFKHNPFSKIKDLPQHDNNEKSLGLNVEEIIAHQYDLVLNGYEIASGSIRENDVSQLIENFKISGYTKEEVELKFKALVNSFKYGCPPHGGAAIGIERLLMIILEETNIRETVAFPLNTSGQDLLFGAPSEISESDLKDLGVKIDKSI